MLLVSILEWQKVIAMTQSLNKDEGAIEHEGNNRGKDKLRRAESRAWRSQRVIWQNHRKDCEWGKHGQSRARSLNLETLLVMPHNHPTADTSQRYRCKRSSPP